MYAPRAFQPDRTASLAFAVERGFGTAYATVAERPFAAAVPFCLAASVDGTPLLSFHVARRNPILAAADNRTAWLMAVSGPDAYVSADWYASEDQVPTWLYQTVHLGGPVCPMTPGELGEHLDALSAAFEERLAPKPAWTSAKISAARLEAMKQAIAGLVMTVESVEGSFKLNQHKSDADRLAVSAELLRQPAAGARTIGQRMVASLPDLESDVPAPTFAD